MSSSRASAALLVCLAAVLLLAGSAQAAPPPLQLTQAAHGLSSPVFMASTPADPTALYVVEQGGTIQRVVDDVTDPQPFLDIHSKISSSAERGLLSMAFSPAYGTDHLIYVYYTDRKGNPTIASYLMRPGKAPKATKLLKVPHPHEDNHNGGQLEFGPDGMLYAGLGDGGGGGDPANNAQNPKKKLGKLLRAAGPKFKKWRIAGYGLRNPWRFSFDTTGDLYIGDVGQGEWEEVDYRAQSDLAAPANYGWSRYEGTDDYNTNITLQPPGVPYVPPVFEYDHSTNNDCAIIGGYVYHGGGLPLMPDEVGRYFFTDLCTGRIRTLVVTGGAASDERDENVAAVASPTSFGLDASGELYVVSAADGVVYGLSE